MVSENMARELWQSPAVAIGKRVRVGSTDDWREIIGVVGNVYDDGMNHEPAKTAYWPIMMRKSSCFFLLLCVLTGHQLTNLALCSFKIHLSITTKIPALRAFCAA